MRSLLFAAALAACNSSTAAPPTPTPPVPQVAKPNPARHPQAAPVDHESELITKELVAMNSNEKWGVPAHDFKPGTVTAKQAPAMKKTAHGFEIQFNNHSPVSTPTVFEGRVYSSGGFNSREFYAFDAKTGNPSWGLDLSDDGPSASACADGTCVFNTESCTVFAVDAKTGKGKWAWFLGDPQTSSPTIAGDRVFTSYPAGAAAGKMTKPPAASHVLAAFDLKTGAVAWQVWLDADVISAPVAVGEFLYVATFNGTVIKFEQATGKIRYATKARATSAPVVEFVAGLESMYYTRRADGAPEPAPSGAQHGAEHAAKKAAPSEQIIRTDHNDPKEVYSTPAKKADYLDGEVQDKSTLKQKASGHDAGNGFSAGAPASANAGAAKSQIGQSNVATIQQFQGSRILHLAKLNVNTMGDEVIATNPADGTQVWSHKLSGSVVKDGGFLGSAPVAAGDHVVLATLEGKILELDPKTGKVEATFEAGGTVRAQPIVVDGWIYVGTEDGRLVAIDTGDRTLTGWAMWGGNAARTGTLAQ